MQTISHGDVAAPPSLDTFERAKALVALPIEESEQIAITHEISEIRKDPAVTKCSVANPRLVREKLHVLSLSAQGGPSGWRKRV